MLSVHLLNHDLFTFLEVDTLPLGLTLQLASIERVPGAFGLIEFNGPDTRYIVVRLWGDADVFGSCTVDGLVGGSGLEGTHLAQFACKHAALGIAVERLTDVDGVDSLVTRYSHEDGRHRDVATGDEHLLEFWCGWHGGVLSREGDTPVEIVLGG